MANIKCSECDNVMEIPDDPRMAAAAEALNKQQQTLEKLVEQLADLGKKVTLPAPPEVPGLTARPKRKKGDAIYEGVFFDYVLDEDEA